MLAANSIALRICGCIHGGFELHRNLLRTFTRFLNLRSSISPLPWSPPSAPLWSDKVGVTGYCMGGALAIASSVLVPGVDAVVAFYGVPSPELADPVNAKAPVQAHFGEDDAFVGFSDVKTGKALEEKLKTSGVPHEVYF